jgi:hypothetical protein
MELLMILFFMVVYIGLAVLFVFVIGKITKRKIFKWLAIVFVILLPIWDVVLGIIVYPFACKFIPKAAIYETAETDGIYYEGDYKNYIFKVGDNDEVTLASLDLERGYNYMESAIVKKSINYGHTYQSITPVVYRCVPLPRNTQKPDYLPIHCVPVSNAQSKYLVKVKKVTMGITEINFMRINNRSTGKLMGEYNEVILWTNFFPFFNWLEWKWWGGKGVSCPAKRKYYSFQYDVLKPKQ